MDHGMWGRWNPLFGIPYLSRFHDPPRDRERSAVQKLPQLEGSTTWPSRGGSRGMEGVINVGGLKAFTK